MKVEVLPGYNVPTAIRKKPFFPGEQFDLDDTEARRLIGLQVVKAAQGGTASAAPQQLNVTETVKLIMAAATLADLEAFKEGETRKGVLDAIAKRQGELEQALIIEKIAGANLDELDELAKLDPDEKRPAIVEAFFKRRQELTEPA